MKQNLNRFENFLSENSNLPKIIGTSVINSSNNLNCNMQDQKLKKRVFLAKKGDSSNIINDSLKEIFENSDNYLKELPNIIIGRVPRGPIEDIKKRTFIPYSFIGGESVLKELKDMKRNKHRERNKTESKNDLRNNVKNTSIKFKLSDKKFTHMRSSIINTEHSANNSLGLGVSINNPLQTHFLQAKGLFESIENNNRINEIEGKFKSIIENNKRIERGERVSNHFLTELQHAINYNNQSQCNSPVSVKKQFMNQLMKDKDQSIILKTESDNLNVNINLFTRNKVKPQKYEEDCLINLPDDIKKDIKLQQKTIKLQETNRRIQNIIENNLSKKLKKPKEDLLINSGDEYMIKSEIKNIIDSKIPPNEKLGQLNWIVSLRKPKDFAGSREVFLNLGSGKSPNWQLYNDIYPKVTEKVANPEKIKVKQSKFNTISFDEKKEFAGLDNNIVSIYTYHNYIHFNSLLELIY